MSHNDGLSTKCGMQDRGVHDGKLLRICPASPYTFTSTFWGTLVWLMCRSAVDLEIVGGKMARAGPAC